MHVVYERRGAVLSQWERVRRAELRGDEKVTIGKPWMLWGLKVEEVQGDCE